MRCALIKDGLVENIIRVDNEDFLKAIASKWDHMVCIDDLEIKPDKGWSYDGKEFKSPIQEAPSDDSEFERINDSIDALTVGEKQKNVLRDILKYAKKQRFA